MSVSSRPTWSATLACVTLVALVGGCAAEEKDGLAREPISGTVTLDGKPLSKGLIQLISTAGADSAPLAGAVITGGVFSIPREQGPIPGTYKVSITAGSGSTAPADELPGAGKAPTKDLIPPRYNLKTTLEAKVAQGASNNFEFQLTAK